MSPAYGKRVSVLGASGKNPNNATLPLWILKGRPGGEIHKFYPAGKSPQVALGRWANSDSHYVYWMYPASSSKKWRLFFGCVFLDPQMPFHPGGAQGHVDYEPHSALSDHTSDERLIFSCSISNISCNPPKVFQGWRLAEWQLQSIWQVLVN